VNIQERLYSAVKPRYSANNLIIRCKPTPRESSLTFCHVQDVHIQEEASVVFNRAKQVAVLAFLKLGMRVFDEIRSLFIERSETLVRVT
jgi:hypothetical protein